MPCRDVPAPLSLAGTMPRLFPIPVLGSSLLLSWPAISLAQINQKPTLKEPTPYQVYQRGDNDQADIPSSWARNQAAEETVSVTSAGPGSTARSRRSLPRRQTPERADGGPYQDQQSRPARSPNGQGGRRIHPIDRSIGPVFVGDLWVLAGQSNMEGVGDLIDVDAPAPAVSSWGWTASGSRPRSRCTGWSTPPTRSTPATPPTGERSVQSSTRPGPRGPASACRSRRPWPRRPACRSAWSPVPTAARAWRSGTPPRRARGATASTARCSARSSSPAARSRACSGTRGRATPNADGRRRSIPKNFADFIAAVRADLDQPELPFYYVQIGRFVAAGDAKGWNAVQDAQRLIPDRVPNTAVVAAIDLELDDLIHVGTRA